MDFIIKIAQAAGNNIVSCAGSDCGTCSLLETVSNIYNFFLGVCFAVAVLVLVVAGVNYLLNGGDWGRLEKSKYILKSGLVGFAVVLLGWAAVQSVIKTVGYPNAGGWWQFQCGEETGPAVSGSTSESLFPSFYHNLKTYPDLTAYFKSGDSQAKIKGPGDALSFSSQLKSLKEGETLHFLAPVQLDSINGVQDLFLPLLSVSKNGENLKVTSTGEYWNLIQNMWPQNLDNSGSDSASQLLNKLLGTNSFTDNRSLINADGSSLNSSDLSGLYQTIADTLGGTVMSGDRANDSTGQGDLTHASLSELIALASSYNQGENPGATDQMIGSLTAQVLKLVSEVVVEKDGSAVSPYADVNCQDPASGDWIKNGCNKDDDGDGVVNGYDRCPGTPAGEKKQVNKTKDGQHYGCSCSDIGTAAMSCPPDQCVGDNWVDYPDGTRECNNGQLDSYSCQPSNRSYDQQCVDQNISGDGTGVGTDTGTGEKNPNTNSNPWAASNNTPFKNNSYGQQNKTGTGNNAGRAANKGTPKTSGGNNKPTTKSDPSKDNWNRDDRNMIPDNNDPGPVYGDAKGIKEALKRIYNRDKLRYLMVFKYINLIKPVSGGMMGGILAGLTGSDEDGQIGINFGMGIRHLDRTIIHETTHRADFCYNGWVSGGKAMEYTAVGNEIGSVGNVKEYPGQKEEIKVTSVAGETKKDNSKNSDSGSSGDRLECRGYGSRNLNIDVDPLGDMNPTAIASDASYAKGYGSDGGGTWTYGWPKGGGYYTLRLNDFEHNRLQIILDGVNKRQCMSRPPDDMPQLTEENGYAEEQLKGCKKEDTRTPIIRIGR